ncbi:MAG: alpha/beta fold hydrolase [Cyanobacteriota bacterium]|nr:alpha/beta fold hydrolase [Cyanobacteriota bacterium]
MKTSHATVRRTLIQTGNGVLILLVAIAIALLVFHQVGLINAWRFPLKPIAAFLGGGGLACFTLAWFSTRRWKKRLLRAVLIAFIATNAIAYLGAYSLTHFKEPGQIGLGAPRPHDSRVPSDGGMKYTVQRIPINGTEWLETWFIPARRSEHRGTVLLFPGRGGDKASQLFGPAKILRKLNYDTLLVDFRGVGGSSGTTTTLGMREAQDVAFALNYARKLDVERPIILYGISMGTSAILRAIASENVEPDAIILELPFARLLDAVKVRLQALNIPSFPLGELMIFWGSIQHGFNGFAHNPVAYATHVNCPTLLLHGQRDRWTSRAEIDAIFKNLPGSKQLVLFPAAAHQLLVAVNRDRWADSIDRFLTTHTLRIQN